MVKKIWLSLIVLITTTFVFLVNSYAADYVITIKDHKFLPQELLMPQGQKIKLTVKNLDNTPAEFESYDLKREKIVSANNEIVVFIGPLNQGTYSYFDDFHPDTAKGTIIVQ